MGIELTSEDHGSDCESTMFTTFQNQNKYFFIGVLKKCLKNEQILENKYRLFIERFSLIMDSSTLNNVTFTYSYITVSVSHILLSL